jgi:glycosyltransferase involved in cell wall biosynthesis
VSKLEQPKDTNTIFTSADRQNCLASQQTISPTRSVKNPILKPDSTSGSAIRVGFVMHKMQVAGAEVLVQQIIQRLSHQIEATVFCLDGIGEIGEQLIAAGTPVISLGRKPGVDWSVSSRLAAELKQRNIQVIHAHQYSPFFYSAFARLRHGVKAKIMFTEHGRHYPDIVSWKRRTVNRFCLLKFADITTACCDFSTRALQNNEGFPNAFTLRNGVDLAELPDRGSEADVVQRRLDLGIDPKLKYVACIARLNLIKDHATLIRAWQLVVRDEPNARLLLIGDGEERESLTRQVQESGLDQHVEFWGIRNDVGRILRSVDVFTLTSTSEAASLTLLEAMASGCASVVTNVGGNAEHLRESIDGFLTPRGDHVALAKRLTELLDDQSKRKTFGAAARERVIEEFSLDNAVASYLQHYQELAVRTEKKRPHIIRSTAGSSAINPNRFQSSETVG